jgi:hypothetical protein
VVGTLAQIVLSLDEIPARPTGTGQYGDQVLDVTKGLRLS